MEGGGEVSKHSGHTTHLEVELQARNAQLPEQPVRLVVWEHCDNRGEFVLDLQRGGLSEDNFSAAELCEIGERLTAWCAEKVGVGS